MSPRIYAALRAFSHEAGLRFLARRKGATLVAVLTMALALGANTAVFAVFKAFLTSAFGLPDADRVFVIAPFRDLPGRGSVQFSDAWPNYQLLRETQQSFTDVTAVVQGVASWDDKGEVRPLQMSRVTASFFSTMGVRPFIGRPFDASAEGVVPARVVIVSYALWQAALGADRSIVGRALLINGEPHTVLGVMPRGFAHPLPTDIWLPFSIPERQMTAITGARILTFLGRLKDGVSREAADGAMASLTARSLAASPDNKDFAYRIATIRETLQPGVDRTVGFVQASALVLLVLAVLNLSSLLIAWGFDRRGEMATRLALGARSLRLVRMALLQSVVVVMAGAATGVLISAIAVSGIRRLAVPQSLGLFLEQLKIDGQVLLWSTLVALIAGALAGLVPGWMGRRIQVADALRSSSRGASASREALRWQQGMVVVQCALSVVVLSSAAIVGTSFRNLIRVPVGFAAEGWWTARLQLNGSRYGDHAGRVAFAARLMERMAREPELAAFGFTSTLPAGDVPTGARFFPDNPGPNPTGEPLLFHARRVSETYLRVVGIPLRQGRLLEARDDSVHPAVIVVSQALATRLWPGESALGKRLYRVVTGSEPQPVEIVGVVGDVHDAGSGAPPGETVYLPYSQVSVTQVSIVVRPRGNPAAAMAAARRAVRDADPVLTLSGEASVEALVSQANALPRLQTILAAVFGLVAIAIAMLGCYGVMSQLVAHRERELSLRLVFGASPRGLGTSVLVQSWRLSAPGVVLGAVVAFLVGETLRPFVFGVDPRSLAITTAVALGVLLLAAVAAMPPALRGARVDVLRSIAG